ncbi:hypothetical protein B0H63DRAFT_529150 [Podospora didyma]|uniref:Protein-ribulosamine 3-kinase n=1 Tax=Podospora didyma TaxID=330526 RepID=A0AAE0K2E9_9PEZI|nr:hypothetical protein B0H63DRAFT_529150 [Podospora didyma]
MSVIIGLEEPNSPKRIAFQRLFYYDETFGESGNVLTQLQEADHRPSVQSCSDHNLRFFLVALQTTEAITFDLNASEIDVDRHRGQQAPTEPVPKTQLGEPFELDQAAIDGTTSGHSVAHGRVWQGQRPISTLDSSPWSCRRDAMYGMSLWGHTAKIMVTGSNGEQEYCSLKSVAGTGTPEAQTMIHGDYDANPKTGFLLTQFRVIGAQSPCNPEAFAARLAALHRDSRSPTGMSGFHVTICHGTIPQAPGGWHLSWEAVYRRMLDNMVAVDQASHGRWPRPTLGPCLVHGELWDEITAEDGLTSEPFVFDAGSFYAHNEYEIGNWRAREASIERAEYVQAYKRHFLLTEPVDEWGRSDPAVFSVV